MTATQANAFTFGETEQGNWMIGCHGANAFLYARLRIKNLSNSSDSVWNYWRSAYTACIWWHEQLCNFSGMHTKTMKKRTAVEIPQTNGKIYTAGKQMAFFVSVMGKNDIRHIGLLGLTNDDAIDYLGCANDGHKRQFTRPRWPAKVWCGGHSATLGRLKCNNCNMTVCVAGTIIMVPSSRPTTKRLCCGK